MAKDRKLTFEQCIKLVEMLRCEEGSEKAERAKLLEWAEKTILDYGILNQLLAGTIEVCVDKDGETSFLPLPGKAAVPVDGWPPKTGADVIARPVSAEESGLYSAQWSGEHRACELDEWLTLHPEAKPRRKFSH